MDVNNIPDVVGITLGAKGKTVILPNGNITKDGVSVAKAYKSKSIVDEVIKQVSLKTLKDVGDGTSSSVVLMQSIYNTLKRKSFPRIAKKLDKEFEIINSIIKQESKPIKTRKNLYDVAYISSNGDEEISKNVSDICHSIGKDGDITLEISEKNETYYKIDNGFKVKDGIISNRMLNGSSEVFLNPVIMVCRDEIRAVKQITSIVEDIAITEKRPLVIVCDKVDSETISTFIINRRDTKFKMQLAIVSTSDIDGLYNNLSTITDSQVMDSEAGTSSYDIERAWLGTCEKVIIENDKTVFVHSKQKKDKPKDIKAKDWEKIISKVATLYIGGSSRPETLEKLDRYDDSLRSSMSAYEDGFAKGGSYIWLKASKEVKLLRKPMQSVFKQMCKNAGYSKLKTYWLLNQCIRKQKPFNFKTEDWHSEKVSDSAKVLRVSIESALSISRLLLNTGAILEDK